jgi:hypothetical protein
VARLKYDFALQKSSARGKLSSEERGETLWPEPERPGYEARYAWFFSCWPDVTTLQANGLRLSIPIEPTGPGST